jgi:hypothetical protein
MIQAAALRFLNFLAAIRTSLGLRVLNIQPVKNEWFTFVPDQLRIVQYCVKCNMDTVSCSVHWRWRSWMSIIWIEWGQPLWPGLQIRYCTDSRITPHPAARGHLQRADVSRPRTFECVRSNRRVVCPPSGAMYLDERVRPDPSLA